MTVIKSVHSIPVAAAAALLREPGAVLLVPTETVYGLVCRWDDGVARERIYTLKGRDHGKPLAMFARDATMATHAGALLNAAAVKLLAAFTPGPLTLIVPGSGVYASIGIRIPAYDYVLKLLDVLGEPLASTSANASGSPNVLSVGEALSELTGAVDMAVDGGRLPANAQASTVVDITACGYKVLRPGPLAESAIRAVLEG